MIKRLQLKNFTAFKELDIKFSSGINVIIGENGTGKTHLLKAAYGICSFKYKPYSAIWPTGDLEGGITLTFSHIFRPLDDKIGKLRRTGATENAKLEAIFTLDRQLSFSFHTNSKLISTKKNVEYDLYSYKPVFIPTKEVLSFMKGFNSLYDKYELAFDQTYKDICSMLELPEMRADKLQKKSKWAMDEIEKICGGKFIFYGGGKVTFKTATTEFSANVIAEGFRKAGMLSRLLETGAIEPGASGPIFWDEPEANMNPKLMKTLVQILLELSRNGQQIIIATHDYVLLKWLDLLMNKDEGDHVKFHTLYRDKETNEVKLDSTDDCNLINKNSISDTFAELYDEDVERAIGGNV